LQKTHLALLATMNEVLQTRSIHQLLTIWFETVSGTNYPQPPDYQGPDVEITGLVEHTDLVEPGKCFVARVRTGSDGHPYIAKAIVNGASLIIGELDQAEIDVNLGHVPYLQVADSAVAMAWLAAAWYRFPSRELLMIGVTGTDGKTTTTNLIYHILQAAGLRAGMLSTIKASLGDLEEPLALHVTTPEAPVIQGYLRQMVDEGVTHCVLEATSHGLAQHRVDAIDFDVAVVTNISHEHLDYHGDYEAYLAAKVRLFSRLTQEKWAGESSNAFKAAIDKTMILNADDSSYARLTKIHAERILTYGMINRSDISAGDISYSADNTQFQLYMPTEKDSVFPGNVLEAPQHAIKVSASLVGEFNLYNMLAAAATGHALSISKTDCRQGLESLHKLTGRMEPIDRGQEFQVIVDFAHTPGALEQAILAARSMTEGRIITVFGSAGKRDVAKRRLMAEVASRDADLAILTAEDPRTESLDDILTSMAAGCSSQGGVEGSTFWRVPDRGQAIFQALSLARPEDLVLICGKGHEQSMCFGTTEYPWDDLEATRKALDAFQAGRPMPDLGLPTYLP
jgi:UDP-N-acetylmuramoyl-L-alanyl-D-glutamate--2,6-diaminopimelate ligase